jgi:hypothetical protein
MVSLSACRIVAILNAGLNLKQEKQENHASKLQSILVTNQLGSMINGQDVHTLCIPYSSNT